MTEPRLSLRAGPDAYRRIKRDGFDASMIGTLAGASGGAKWLILSQLDRVVIDRLLPSLVGPVFTIGSSIGAWRFACYAQQDPLAAIERFEEAYIAQRYSDKPDRHEITKKSVAILDDLLGEHGVRDILSHPVLHSGIMTVRSRHALASESRALLLPALMAAAAMNVASRRSLGLSFERALFFDGRAIPPFAAARGFPMHRIPLSAANVKEAILATGSIPMVLSGVRDIDGAPAGVYRDGGVIDYHLDLPLVSEDRLVLYLHFVDRIVPGWFDKKLKFRRFDPSHHRATLLISPSQSFVASLPHGKIPDRKDFEHFPAEEREKNWRIVVDRCREMADEFKELLDNGRLAERLEPL